jgi:hypothetical protein
MSFANRGLWTSSLAHYFGLENPAEAAAYWDDDVLGCIDSAASAQVMRQVKDNLCVATAVRTALNPQAAVWHQHAAID